MAIVPFIVELWLQCAIILLIWLVTPIALVAKGKFGAAAAGSILVSIAWIVVSFVLFYASGKQRWALRDGQTWVSLLWLASAVGALSSIALSTVLLIVRKHIQTIRVTA